MGNSQSPKQLLVNQQYTFRTDAFNVLEKSPLAASHKFKGRKFERFRHCLDNVQVRLGASLQSFPWLFRLCSHLLWIALAPARQSPILIEFHRRKTSDWSTRDHVTLPNSKWRQYLHRLFIPVERRLIAA